MLTLADVLEALTGLRPAWAWQVVTEGTMDSRQVVPGALFVALPGEQSDGHDYVGEALQKGAVVALIEKDMPDLRLFDRPVPTFDLRNLDTARTWPAGIRLTEYKGPFCLRVENTLAALQQVARFWRRKLNVRVIGITGSVGKSTTKEVVAELLSQRYRTLKNRGNFNNEIGLPLTLLSLTEEHERAVLEMGLYVPGEIAFLSELAQPEIGVITNIGTVHAERAGSIEAIVAGKAELVQSLPSNGVAILNYDDPHVRGMADQTKARVFFYGLDPNADLWAEDVEGLGLEGIRFILHYREEVLNLRVPLIGRHSVHTALRAAAVGLVDGLTWEEIIGGLRTSTTQLRLVAVRTKNGALILDDTYNASPESTLAALNLLEELEGRKVAVLGDMLELGPYEEQGHEMVGVRAAEVADELICVGERAGMIAAAAQSAGLPADQVKLFETNEQVIDHLQPRLSSLDVILVKGSRGMRMEEITTALEARR